MKNHVFHIRFLYPVNSIHILISEINDNIATRNGKEELGSFRSILSVLHVKQYSIT